jgi:pantoate--beta-alanine ligase
MQTVSTVMALREHIGVWRRAGERVAFVPTMGNLHAGHYALIARARELAERVVASVFVNPTQFGPNEDFSRYPRTLAEDQRGLETAACDLLFTPDVSEMYPYGASAPVQVVVPIVTEDLDGAARPGHFTGVASVVTRLFNMVDADFGVFGQKDYQQLLVIRRLVRDLAMPIEIVAVPTVREANGLAMSSRNQYLDAGQRERARVIYATLQSMAAAFRAGQPIASIESDADRALRAAGLVPDYAVVRDADDLHERPDGVPADRVALIAARLGSTRLIDNLLIPKTD